MHSLVFLLVSAMLSCSVLAIPTPHDASSKRSFSIPIQRSHRLHKDPVEAMRKVARKFGWKIIVYGPDASPIATITTVLSDVISMPTDAPTLTMNTAAHADVVPTNAPSTAASSDSSTTTNGNADDGEVSAIPDGDDSEYLSPVTIGGQSLNLDFDTGSADLWVFSTSLSSSTCSQHTCFDTANSSSWQPFPGASWQIVYGDGSRASGTVGFDQVKIGGAVVQNQAVELASKVGTSFLQDVENDGLLGLGFSNINCVQPTPQKTFFDNIKSLLTSPLFTADLEDDASGTYEFGQIDSTKYKGEIQYTPVDPSRGFWQFDSPQYAVGNSSPAPCQVCSPSIADTGTSLMIVDDDVAEAYYSQVPSATFDSSYGGYTYPCNNSMPSLSVAMGANGTLVTLDGNQAVYNEIGNGWCFGGIQGNQGQGMQIFGDVFFKQFFAVFDGADGAERFGVALKDK